MKALYFEILQFQKENIDLLNQHFELIRILNPSTIPEDLFSEVEVAFAPLGYYFGDEQIDRMPNLKVIASNTTGDSHIDVAYANKNKIKVITLKKEDEFLQTITSTAEHTWGLILSLVRKLPWAYSSVINSSVWNRRPFGGQAMLSSMTLGIVGFGRLGKMLARYGLAFGMKVKFFDPYVENQPFLQVNKCDSLKQLVSTSEIITIHVPLEKETEKIFNAEIFAALKEGSYLINTSRGEIVNEKEMLKSLKQKRLAGAAIDVIAGEFGIDFNNKLKDHPLIEYSKENDNLIITPHIGGSTLDAWYLTEKFTIMKIVEYATSKLALRQ